MPNRLRRALLLSLALICTLIFAACAFIYARSQSRIARRHLVPVEKPLELRSDSATLARGQHLATSVGLCVVCHGDDLGGKVYSDAGAVIRVVGPNLTSGRGGRGGRAPGATDSDWERALRHGVHADGTSLVVMPSEVFTHLTDTDAAALISYLRALPPIDRTLPRTRFGPVGRMLLARGKFTVLVAEKTPHIAHVPTISPDTSIAYGAYLANIGGCRGCHGLHLSGGRVIGPPGTPQASNLTPRGLAGWSEADFVRTIRTGRRPSGTMLDSFMPWSILARMTDAELHAIWRYLQSVPPEDFGNR
jgi:mono/diheme cytochrome c family protein